MDTMCVHPKTRATGSTRWIRAALAMVVLASGTLLAQDKDKEKKPPPPPAHKNAPANTPAKPAEQIHPGGNQPANNTPPHPANPAPAVHPNGNPPVQNDRPRPTGTLPPANTPGRQFGTGGAPNVTRGPVGTPVRNNAATMPGAARPVYHGPNGSEVHYRSNGQPQMVKARGMTITHSPSGVRRAEVVRPDHSVIVTQGGHYGYVQRNYVVNNVTYVHRTYVVGGVSYARIYRPYVYYTAASR
jgi:hypothetical protein